MNSVNKKKKYKDSSKKKNWRKNKKN